MSLIPIATPSHLAAAMRLPLSLVIVTVFVCMHDLRRRSATQLLNALNCSGWECLYIRSGASGVDGSSSEVKGYY